MIVRKQGRVDGLQDAHPPLHERHVRAVRGRHEAEAPEAQGIDEPGE